MPGLRTSTKLKLGYAAIAALDTWLAGSSGPRRHRARWLTKPLLMPLLSASLTTNAAAASSPLRTSTLLAQAAGWGGDLALMSHRTPMFAAGTASFAVGHAAYIGGFRRRRPGTRPAALGASPPVRALAGTWLIGAPALALGARRTHPGLGLAVLGYSAILTAMAGTATRLDPAMPAAAQRLTLLGAGLFVVSDAVLGSHRFLLDESHPGLEPVVMATYTAAQFLLSEGAARA